MARQIYKIPVASAKFPFDYSKAGRGIVQPGLDVTSRAPVSFAGGAESLDHNVPQLLHCENMMPVDTGMRAVGFLRTAAGYGNTLGMKKLFLIRHDAYLADNGNRWFSPGLSWQALTGATLPARPVSAAALGEVAYVLAPDGSSVFEVNGAGVVTARSFILTGTGVSGLSIKSICASGNYLIALPNTYPTSPLLWSSLTNPLDFSDTAAGAGRAIPSADIGGAHSLVGTRDGFIIVGYLGMIAATATNDATRPFSFKVIPNASGVSGPHAVVQTDVAQELYILTSAGIQRVTHQRAETVFPDAYDFLRESAHTVWNGTALETVPKAVIAAVRYISERYVVISYGSAGVVYDAAIFSHALLYDTQLSRWGKIRLSHTAVAEIKSYATEEAYRIDRVAFVALDGAFYEMQLDSSFNWATAPGGSIFPDGVAVFGHIKATRARRLTFHEAIIDGAPATSQVRLLPSVPGVVRTSVALSAVTADGDGSSTWRGRHTGDNFDLSVSGELDLTTVIVETQQHGSR